uniref:Putative polysaccharide deacetylase n=1 Tax=viral metagenome TaxID=1070528 RepID=A0A6M3M9S6_9ZZZZ
MIIWFDDGYEVTYTKAYPVMKKLGLTGIVALATGYVGLNMVICTLRPGYGGNQPPRQMLSIDQLKELVADGWEIASHSVTHPYRFDELTIEDTRWELLASRDWIKDNLSVTPKKFVVPRHLIRPDQKDLVKQYYEYMRPLGGRPADTERVYHWLINVAEIRSFAEHKP